MDKPYNKSNLYLTNELRVWFSKKIKEGWSAEVILDSMGTVEQDNRHLYNL